ncbi:hypothetical protein [Ethanoligenens harbinense]|uniref:Chloramphenicol resistance protein n=1 Tax=Ethanoligenens harbinense (strain DSM 18485 / JCM 12961 / CGMCC 1.5033 / YUAN-3) TaxID=663278 RepID=E6U913_ETHHY|nr:hypothetical protein [Ethanoligenens harbinense]ADU26077.1 hypothetical protein Ethha_0492 [Ethanoligenens harbinense YUAN-3]AVQ95220.1 hypothetical protein CXQ68_02555 [Ethanoligenens harbinense YUAN-3]AYF37911.1 hypothetical protein CXP51_02570 [Ethanoligenens harbinense]AYF40631.1 hypothetical protein CN246_02555 [Ethanoligenens harbinense]QCN91465.1 hypothetical protein DRA42_02565 [Ethanoligenens harbinense]
MSIINSLYEYFKSCPLLGDNKINVDYLPETAREYTIDTITGDPIIKRYARGATLRQYLYAFGSRDFYGPDVLQNLSNSGFYGDFAAWLDEQNKAKNFPVLPPNCVPQKIEAQTSGYLFGADAETARYQIQCRIVYYQEG